MAHDKEKYEGQLGRFLASAKGLDESLTLFFSQAFSKDSFVTPNFFSLVEKMKTLDGTYVQSALKGMDDTELTARIRCHCVSETSPKAEYVFEDVCISYNKAVMSRTFYDPDRKVSLSDLRGMEDFKYFSFLNAFDLPYLIDTTVHRSSIEHFISAFLDELVRGENPENTEFLRFNLVKDGSAHLGFTIKSWVQILYCIARIMRDILDLAFDAMREKIPLYYPMVEKIKFIEQFVVARQKLLASQIMPETTEAFRDFLRIDFTSIAAGNSREMSEKTPLGKLEFAMELLDNFILLAKGNSKKAMIFFTEYQVKNNLSGDCREFCEMSLRFQSAFDHFLDAVMDKEDVYQLMLKSGIQLLKILYPGSFPHVPLDPKSSSNPPTPRSRRGTPRDDSPRVVGRGSPRDALRSSADARAAQIEMWKRKSTGGGSPSPEPGSRSPGPTHSASGSGGNK